MAICRLIRTYKNNAVYGSRIQTHFDARLTFIDTLWHVDCNLSRIVAPIVMDAIPGVVPRGPKKFVCSMWQPPIALNMLLNVDGSISNNFMAIG